MFGTVGDLQYSGGMYGTIGGRAPVSTMEDVQYSGEHYSIQWEMFSTVGLNIVKRPMNGLIFCVCLLTINSNMNRKLFKKPCSHVPQELNL